MVLDVHEGTDTTDIVTTVDGDQSAVLELDNSVDLTSLKVELIKREYIKYKKN